MLHPVMPVPIILEPVTESVALFDGVTLFGFLAVASTVVVSFVLGHLTGRKEGQKS